MSNQIRTVCVVFRAHWPEYLIEMWGLGTFVVSARLFATLMDHPRFPSVVPCPMHSSGGRLIEAGFYSVFQFVGGAVKKHPPIVSTHKRGGGGHPARDPSGDGRVDAPSTESGSQPGT